MTVVRELPPDLVLKHGAHGSPVEGLCVMEAAAWVAGEEHSDEPVCACPIVGAFLRSWNDSIPDDARRTELLAPLVLRLVDSKSTAAVERMRADLAIDWLARVQAPTWFALSATLLPHAAVLRGLAPLTSAAACEAAQPALTAAWDAARAAARDAARAAARDAARDAARAAADSALRPSVAALQASALILVDRMLAVTPDTTPEQLDALAAWPAVEIARVS